VNRYLFLLFLLFACCSRNKHEAASKQPDIIWIYSDDHDQRAISAYKGMLIQTPNIDRLANEGLIFENSFVSNSICAPCRAVILTGKHSHLNGVVDNGTTL
jgi:arylsulfatase A-like enzyme